MSDLDSLVCDERNSQNGHRWLVLLHRVRGLGSQLLNLFKIVVYSAVFHEPKHSSKHSRPVLTRFRHCLLYPSFKVSISPSCEWHAFFSFKKFWAYLVLFRIFMLCQRKYSKLFTLILEMLCGNTCLIWIHSCVTREIHRTVTDGWCCYIG